MLPLLIESATIFLHPEYIAAVKQAGVFKKQISDKEVIAVRHLEGSSASESVIVALKALLDKPAWKNCNARLILSGYFTQFRVALWNDGLTQEEQKTRALNQLEEIYDVNGKSLHIFISDNGYRKNSLAFAIEKDFYTALQRLEKARLIRLHAIIPYFVQVMNYWRQSISSSAWVIFKENVHVYYAKLVKNSWAFIKVDALKDGWEQEAQKILSRDAMQSEEGAIVNQIYFHEDNPLSNNIEAINSLDQNVVILGRNIRKDKNRQLSFASYLP